ncbi:hypothetical protein CC2G_001648 [Coprinopsis cinerea AmutBmut pab1-1]|nr:hypothetical protein CC2G_001648 [Coprinopsis cinerea AmutBmut pab1-1]
MKIFLRIRNFISSRLRRRHSLHIVRHPMDQLPNEILAYIFALIILDPSENPAFVSKLGQVCSRWRALVVSTASLWSRIVLAYPMNNPQLVYAAIALERSAAHPLDILLDCRDPEWDWEEETHNFQGTHMQSILPLILPHSSRWKKIEVLSDTWAPVHAFLQATQETPLPILESASLSRCNAYFAAPGETFQPESMRSPIALFGGRSLQSLRDVSLVGVHVDWDKSALVHLRRLEFKYHSRDVMPTIHQFLRILGQCPDLLELSIVGWGPILGSQINRGHSDRTSISSKAILRFYRHVLLDRPSFPFPASVPTQVIARGRLTSRHSARGHRHLWLFAVALHLPAHTTR